MDVRIPVTPNLHINDFNGGSITELESGITNGIIQQKGGVPYLTQRPTIDIYEDAGAQGAGSKGRGLYFWDENTSLYIINDGTLYKDSQGSSLSTSPSAGTKRCYFFPIGGKLILFDPENDEGWSITTAGAVAAISDGDFPSTLAGGGAVLNGALYVLDEDGNVYGSDSNDGTSWTALNFLNASRDPDGGVYLAKHHDNLAVFGPASTEFFYDAGNATGSPLARRQDVSYNIGCATHEAVWETGDRVFFVGLDSAGSLSVYLLQQFNIAPVSTPELDSMLTQAFVKDGYTVIGSGFSAAGHDFYIITFVTTPDSLLPETSLCYDATTGIWSEWSTTVNSITQFPLVAWTKRDGTTTQYGQGIFSNGDLISVNDNLNPQDTLLASNYVVEDYVDAVYTVDSSESGTPIALTSRTGMYDGGTNRRKYPESLRFVGNRTPTSQDLTIKWADESNTSFSTGRTQDMSINRKLHRLGRFQRRNHEIQYSGTDPVWIEALEMPIRVGNN